METVNNSQVLILKMRSLHEVVCRLCFGMDESVQQFSVFSSFADGQRLDEVIRTCFGVAIKEDDFCSDICEQCLVKVDLTWQFYSTISANCKALNEITSSVGCTDSVLFSPYPMAHPASDEQTICSVVQVEDPIKSEPEWSSVHTSLPNDEEDACHDDEEDALPEHPFFSFYSPRAYNCHLCPKVLITNRFLELHLLRDHKLKTEQILCHYCAKLCKPRSFIEHVKIHSEEKLVCSICNLALSNAANFRRHMRVHFKGKPFRCKYCDAVYNQSETLKKHMNLRHLGVVPPFKSKSALDAPKNSKAARSMSCPVCEESFYMQSKLITHLEESHPSYKVKILRCDQCPERFIRQASYYNHRAYRHSEKDYLCDECAKVFPSAQHLYDHKKRCQPHSAKRAKKDD